MKQVEPRPETTKYPMGHDDSDANHPVRTKRFQIHLLRLRIGMFSICVFVGALVLLDMLARAYLFVYENYNFYLKAFLAVVGIIIVAYVFGMILLPKERK